MDDFPIYRGIWINHEYGNVKGLTLTVSRNGAAFLIAFLALYVTLVAGQSWSILRFVLHQWTARADSHNIKHYQQQVLLRNTPSALQAAYGSTLITRRWRQAGGSFTARDWYLPFLAVLNVGLFATAGVLSSQVSKTASPSFRLRADACNTSVIPSGGALSADEEADILTKSILADMVATSAINIPSQVRTCYDGHYGGNYCSDTFIDFIHTTIATVPCPFDRRICAEDAFRMDTGLLDSSSILGLNGKDQSERLYFRHVADCASLNLSSYTSRRKYKPPNSADLTSIVVTELHLGTLDGANWTFQDVAVPLLSSVMKTDPTDYDWLPIPELRYRDSDLSIIALTPNNLSFLKPLDDPFFAATKQLPLITPSKIGNTTYCEMGIPSISVSTNAISAIACEDRFQVCTTESNCLPLSSSSASYDLQGRTEFSKIQTILYGLLMNIAEEMVLGQVVANFGVQLRAAQINNRWLVPEAPQNQRHIEMQNWFNLGLSYLQTAIVLLGYPGIRGNGTILSEREGQIICPMIMTRRGGFHQNFSVLGMILILSIGSLVIIVGWTIEPLAAICFGWQPEANARAQTWLSDNAIELQSSILEAKLLSSWVRDKSVPVSKTDVVLSVCEYATVIGPQRSSTNADGDEINLRK